MLKTLFAISMLAWALWLGGLVALLLFVTQLFAASRDMAIHSAPVLFRTFAAYQIVVGLILCITATAHAWMTRSSARAICSMMFLIALSLAMTVSTWTRQMLELIGRGESSGGEFLSLHIRCNVAYLIEAILLFIGGVGTALLPITSRRSASEKVATTSPATDFPAAAANRS